MKKLLLESISRLETYRNLVDKRPDAKNEPVKITTFFGYKPSSYFVPQMVFSTKQALEEPTERPMAYFVEIFWNGVCVFRESHIDPNKTPKELEDIVLHRTLISILTHGLFYAKETIFKLHEERSDNW